jgi:hypothetical protein
MARTKKTNQETETTEQVWKCDAGGTPVNADKDIIPPTPAPNHPKWKIDESGLYNHVNYIFNEDGSVDWRKMINPEHIVPNREKTSETDITKLEDKDLLIKLAGFKELAMLRRFTKVKHKVLAMSETSVAVRTTITWAPNFETGMAEVSFDSMAEANYGNTSSFGRQFLTTTAENRGFVRAVRNFLRVHVIGQDEIGAGVAEKSTAKVGGTLETLEKLINSRKIPFESFKNRMIKEKVEGAEDWQNLQDLSEGAAYVSLEKLRAILAEKDAKEEAKKLAQNS